MIEDLPELQNSGRSFFWYAPARNPKRSSKIQAPAGSGKNDCGKNEPWLAPAQPMRWVPLAAGYFTANIRSKAISDHRVVSSSTRILLTGVPAARFSRLQHKWAKSMRYIVAHMQTTGERK